MNYKEKLISIYKDTYSSVFDNGEYYFLYKHFSYGAEISENEFKVLDTFKNCSLLFSKPNKFNDPFDCYCHIDYDFSRITRAELEDILRTRITNKEFRLRKDTYIRDLKNNPVIQNWGELRRNSFRLTCFNNSPLNILMWSHYACNHQGFLVEFKFKKIENSFTNLPVPVLYNNEFPRINYPYNANTKMCLDNENFGAESVIKLFANKAECWAYENEFRLLDLSNTNSKSDKLAIEVEPEIFSNVIYGIATPEKCIEKTEEAIKTFNQKNTLNLTSYKAAMKKNKYEIYVPDHPRLTNQ